MHQPSNSRRTIHTLAQATTVLGLALASLAAGAQQNRDHRDKDHFAPGNLVVSRSVYDNNPANVKVGTILPPNCASTQGGCGAATGAPYNGTYPGVFNDVLYDPSFGITSRIFLDQITPDGRFLDSLEVPNSLDRGIKSTSDQLVTSFSSKSEIALHLSTDHRALTFMGYVAPVNTIDVSNSNTPLALDPTNPVGQEFLRGVATVDRNGHFNFTESNAYSGNNGRAVILNNTEGEPFFYTAGNAGNGANPQPDGIVLGAGAQFIDLSGKHEAQQDPGTPTPVASFSVTQLGNKADKVGKDDNFRGMTIFNNVLYYTKGSGSNGVNTVYFVDTTGKACPNGVGLPAANAQLPTMPLTYDPAALQTTGLPSNMCILAGFPTALAKNANPVAFPFELWFANATTLYVADEGDGFADDSTLYTHAAAQTTAGLQKWIFNKTTNTWNLATPSPTVSNSACLTPCTAIRPATTLRPACPGHRQLMACATWKAASTVTAPRPSGPSPRPSAAAVTPVPTPTASLRSTITSRTPTQLSPRRSGSPSCARPASLKYYAASPSLPAPASMTTITATIRVTTAGSS